MQRSAIAFVLGKSVGRIARFHFDHEAVARDLGDHAGRRDAEAESVAADEGGLRNGEGEYRQAVDQGVIRRDGQRGERAAHRFVRGSQDIEPVDFLGIDDRHRPADFTVAGKFREQPFAGSLRQFFGVVEFLVMKTVRQNHGGRDHRSGEWAASGFIDPRHAQPALLTQRAFVIEGAIHRRGVASAKPGL